MIGSAKPRLDPARGARLVIERFRGVSFRQHIGEAFPGYRWYRYNKLIVDVLQRLVDGTLLLQDGSVADRVFIAIKTQTGKSTILQLFASWMARIFPGICQGSSMHNHDMTIRFSKFVRKFYAATGGTFESKAIHNWHTSTGSEFWACSKNTSPTGRPATVLYPDDLVSGWREASSVTVSREDIEWLTSEFMQRLSPMVHPKLGRQLMVTAHTRWSFTDVQAFLLSLGRWYCVILPTVYEPDTWPIELRVGPFPIPDMEQEDKPWVPKNCVIAPDWREYGEALEPSEKFLNREAFESRRRKNGTGGLLSEERVAAIEQQCPRPAAGGGVFHPVWFTPTDIEPADPAVLRTSRAHDFASTPGAGHWSANAKTSRTRDSRYVIRHGSRGQLDAQALNWLVAYFMIVDGPHCHVVFPEAKAEGKLTVHGFKEYLHTVTEWAGVHCPPIRTAPVGTKRPQGDERSAKYFRWAEGPLSLRSQAKPVSWDAETLEISIPGSYSMVMTPWKPDIRKTVTDFEKRAAARPDLLKIERIGLAATGQLSNTETKALHISTDSWQFAGREDLRDVNAYGGGTDDWIDALADAHSDLARPMREAWAG